MVYSCAVQHGPGMVGKESGSAVIGKVSTLRGQTPVQGPGESTEPRGGARFYEA